MLKLEWRANESGLEVMTLFVNELCVGEIHDHSQSMLRGPGHWRAWKVDSFEGSSLGFYGTADEAREAVETWAKQQLEL